MITSGINFINFKIKKKSKLVKNFFFSLLKKKNEVINSLSKEYKNSFNKKAINKYKKVSNYQIIGMGGSTLGAQAIYDFLNHKIRSKFNFVDNLQPNRKLNNKKNFTNLIVSKSGNTIETIIKCKYFNKKKGTKIFLLLKIKIVIYCFWQKNLKQK
jgi:glucose-6-phosphate isomerase